MKKMVTVIGSLSAMLSICSMGMLTAFAEDAAAASDTGAGATAGALFSTLGLPILLLVLLYFIMVRPQQKQEKEKQQMQHNLQIGDEVVTIGGIVGIVLRIEEATETVVLETGSDRLKIRMKQNAIAENITAQEQAEAEKAEKQKKRMGAINTGKPKDE